MQELRYQVNRFRISGLVLKQDKSVWSLLQQNSGFVQRAGVLQFRNQQ
jgi:hypothetical protein